MEKLPGGGGGKRGLLLMLGESLYKNVRQTLEMLVEYLTVV